MSKELVISSNRHETKVAILEDEQLVEVFFQRANEYSLAGSIHKGRVTRVLPGMQSAFVDLGLERDTFLYVSDFFEENEEYDRLPSGDDRRPKPAPQQIARPAGETGGPPQAAAAVETSPPGARADDSLARDRRGRRSRRRRGRGRGFPDSKYAPESAPSLAEEAVAAAENAERIILPGESLAKYQRAAGPAVESAPETGEQAADERPETAEEDAAEDVDTAPDIEEEPGEAEPEIPVTAADQTGEAPPAIADIDFAEEEEEEDEEETEIADQRAERAQIAAEAVIAAEQTPGIEGPEGESAEAAPPGAAGIPPAEAGGEEAAAAPKVADGPEPARIPQSLTAALRERDRGARFQGRMSRRIRRRGRTGQDSAPRVEESEERQKGGMPSISDLLKEGQEILVQVAKEPMGQKGARITSHIALPGRYCVYMPTVDHIGVSRKIPGDEERHRLKRILQTHRAGMPGGFIIRTAGEGHSEEEIAADMSFLYNLWTDIRQRAERKPAPCLVHHDLDIVQRILRDQFTESFKNIWVDNEELYTGILSFVQRFQPALLARVKLYTRPTPIFDAFGVTGELEKALRPKVWLKSGGYIVINQTEALVAIDINTGKFVGKSNRLEDTIVKTNTEAIKEIVRQIRLRDLGGIIVVDFIDMDERKNRQKVMQALEDAMRQDRAPYKILQFNDFGLVAITRKRVKQSLERTLCAPCPYCEGAGYVKSVQTVIGEILVEAGKIAKAVEGKEVVLRVSPEVAKVLKSTSNQYLEELEEILGRPVMVTSEPGIHTEKFDIA